MSDFSNFSIGKNFDMIKKYTAIEMAYKDIE